MHHKDARAGGESEERLSMLCVWRETPLFSDAERDALVETVSGALLGGVRSPVLERAFDYWKSIDPDVGRRIEETVRRGHAPEPAAGMSES